MKPIAGFECSLDEEPFSTCANTNPATINLYWVAPIIGGLISAGVYKVLHKDEDLPLPPE
jgi:hypothetical protein